MARQPRLGRTLGYDAERLAVINRTAIMQLAELRARLGQNPETYIISGCIGPRHDGYDAAVRMSAPEAERYHEAQIQTFADTPVDLVSALTITYVDEAIGITRAAARAGLPVVISFTVETDGRLPSGTTVQDAILQVDAATDRRPAYYMLNCAHPSHFSGVLEAGRGWPLRIRGIRANASRRSHAELDAASKLDDGDPVQLAVEYRQLVTALPAAHHPGRLLRDRSPARVGHRRGVRRPVRADPGRAHLIAPARPAPVTGSRGLSGRWPRSARDRPDPGRRRRACTGRCSPGGPG